MRQAAAFMVGAGSVAVIAVGLQVGLGGLSHQASASSENTSSTTDTSTTSPTSSNTAAATPASTPATSSAASPKASASSSSSSSNSSSGITGTFHGVDVADDAGYGDVQVDVVFKNGTVTDVVFVSANATKGRDQAFPMLRQETLTAQSSNISNISGATFTSDAYMRSIQSAFDAAGFTG